jgi:sugar lactone lactonase YvrE
VPAGASASAAVPLGSGLKAPNGVAVDGAGNVYVADTGNSQIVEIPVVNGALSTSAQTTLISSSTVVAGSALSNPAGIAVDSLGNLYIADSGNKRVVYVPYADSLVLSFATTLGSGMSSPSAITVDASGNVYVADEGNGDVYELTAPLSAGAQATVASGYNKPSGLAVDASGALFVVDQGNQAIWRVPNISGNLTQASAVNVVGQLDPSTESQIVKDPYGVAIDSIGNLYVSDNKNATVYQVNRIAGTQFLGYWNPGSTSTDGSVSLESSGNAALTLNSPFYSLSGDTAEFTALTSETNACASGSVASGSSCSLEATFTPAALTSNSEIYTLSSNAANSTSQQVTFSGTGLPTAATTTAVAITSPTGAISYDQSVTVQVTVASVDSSNGIPSGKVQFLLDGSVKQTVVLDNKGTASYTFPGGPLIPGGSQAFSAVYLGAITPNFAYSQSTSAPLNVTVQTVATSNTLSFATAFINPASQAAGTSITFTATITSTFAGTPTGKVTFVVTDAAGGTPVSLPVLIGSTNGGVATATYTLPAPISSVYDVISVVATYSGDANFAGSTSAVETFNLAPTFSSSPGSVSLTASGTSITSGISSGGNITFTPTSQGGWNGLVGFSCLASSLPEYTQCVWSPGQVQLGPSTTGKVAYQPTVTLSIAINQPPQTPTASKLVWWIGGLTGLVLLFARRRWMRKGLASFAMLVGVILLGVSATGLTACNNTDNIPFASPIGSKTITVLVSSDPFSSPPTFSTPIPSTKPCGINPTTNLHDSTLAPCTQQTYQVNVSVQ